MARTPCCTDPRTAFSQTHVCLPENVCSKERGFQSVLVKPVSPVTRAVFHTCRESINICWLFPQYRHNFWLYIVLGIVLHMRVLKYGSMPHLIWIEAHSNFSQITRFLGTWCQFKQFCLPNSCSRNRSIIHSHYDLDRCLILTYISTTLSFQKRGAAGWRRPVSCQNNLWWFQNIRLGGGSKQSPQ